MRIAQVAPLFESVPPKLYGGTERVVSYLTEELVRQGHDGTLIDVRLSGGIDAARRHQIQTGHGLSAPRRFPFSRASRPSLAISTASGAWCVCSAWSIARRALIACRR